MSENWGIETDAQDFFGNQKKRSEIEKRRPSIRKSSDLVGPGISASAVRITNFDDILATFDGYYSYKFESAAASTAAKAPRNSGSFIGYVVMDDELGGIQVFTSLTNGEEYTRIFLRSPSDLSFVVFGAWKAAEIFPPAFASNSFPTTVCPTNQDTPLTMPTILREGDNWAGTYERTDLGINILRPGIYTGYCRVQASGTAFTGTFNVDTPNRAGVFNDTVLNAAFANGVIVPIMFRTSVSTGFVRLRVQHTAGADRTAMVTRITLARVGDSPAA